MIRSHRFAVCWTTAALAAALTLGATELGAAVSNPHPGMTLVTHSGRATLVTDLCTPGVAVRATKYAERKKTAKVWGESLGLQAAINADFFDYPDATLVIGRAMGDGEWWPPGTAWVTEQDRPYWQFGPRLAEGVPVGFTEPSPDARNIVGGHNVIIQNGASTAPWEGDAPLLYGYHRRTGVGISADRRTLYFTTVGESITAEQLISYMVSDAGEAGAPAIDYANNMDGGGSSQMWVQASGWAVSSTRQVANHLGVWATGTGTAENCRPRYQADLEGSTFPLTIEGFGSEGVVEIELGETVTGTITFSNAADASWTADTKLAPTPRDEPHPLAAADWLAPHRISHPPSEVAPEQAVDFPLSIHGGAPGEHQLKLTLVQEAVTWFGDAPLGGGPGDGIISIEVRVSDTRCEPPCGSGGEEAACVPECGADEDDGGPDGCGGICGSPSAGTTDDAAPDEGCSCGLPGRQLPLSRPWHLLSLALGVMLQRRLRRRRRRGQRVQESARGLAGRNRC